MYCSPKKEQLPLLSHEKDSRGPSRWRGHPGIPKRNASLTTGEGAHQFRFKWMWDLFPSLVAIELREEIDICLLNTLGNFASQQWIYCCWWFLNLSVTGKIQWEDVACQLVSWDFSSILRVVHVKRSSHWPQSVRPRPSQLMWFVVRSLKGQVAETYQSLHSISWCIFVWVSWCFSPLDPWRNR